MDSALADTASSEPAGTTAEPDVQMLAVPEGSDEGMPVQLRDHRDHVDPGQPGLLADLALRGGIQAGVFGLEVTTQLQPDPGLAMVGKQDPLEPRVEDQGARGEVGRRPGLGDTVGVGAGG